jgi:hypothetical protein
VLGEQGIGRITMFVAMLTTFFAYVHVVAPCEIPAWNGGELAMSIGIVAITYLAAAPSSVIRFSIIVSPR